LFQASLGKIVPKTPSQPIKLGVVAHICHLSYAGSRNRRIDIQASPVINAKDPLSKIIKPTGVWLK
jgi:hypothetical protein